MTIDFSETAAEKCLCFRGGIYRPVKKAEQLRLSGLRLLKREYPNRILLFNQLIP